MTVGHEGGRAGEDAAVERHGMCLDRSTLRARRHGGGRLRLLGLIKRLSRAVGGLSRHVPGLLRPSDVGIETRDSRVDVSAA